MNKVAAHLAGAAALAFTVAGAQQTALPAAVPDTPPDQEPLVTFYDTGKMLPPYLDTNHKYFSGVLFDGKDHLAVFSNMLALFHGTRFITFRFEPGVHTFSASVADHPARNSQTTVNLEAGKHYFFLLHSQDRSLKFDNDKGELEQKTCAEAHAEAEDSKPLSERLVTREARPYWINEAALPACP